MLEVCLGGECQVDWIHLLIGPLRGEGGCTHPNVTAGGSRDPMTSVLAASRDLECVDSKCILGGEEGVY